MVMSNVETTFGQISFPESVTKKRRAAILRALGWCEQICTETGAWSAQASTHGQRLVRTINGHELAVFPLVAAKLDAGRAVGARFENRHLPVEVNGLRVCVAPSEGRVKDLHADMVACLLLLCGAKEVQAQHLPSTLRVALFPERYSRGGRVMFDPVADQRRRDVQAAFLAALRPPEQAVEHALNTISRDDWALLRDTFRWPYYGEAARAIALRLLGHHQEHHEDDIIWALTQLRLSDDPLHFTIVRSLVTSSNNTDVIRAALAAYHSSDAEMAWNDLHALLNHPIETLAWGAHARLDRFEELEARLVERSDIMLEETSSAWLEQNLVAWLSHRQNMDVWVRRILEELPHHELGRFLERVGTHGAWFERWAKEVSASPLEGVQIGIVEASKRNMAVNHGQLWLPLMKNGSGEVKRVILYGMRDIRDEDAYMLVDEVWDSPRRFVLRAAYMLVPHNFPNYPRMREMFEAGLSSPHARIRITAQKRLDAMDEKNGSAN